MELAPYKSRNGKTLDKSRRVWLPKEEEALITSLKDITAKGWRCENGFRTGYLLVLERAMVKVFPNTDIKAEPHINSKIHVWKKFHKSLTSMLAQKGITWNEKEKTIEAKDDAWDAYVKTDSHARTMRYKTWPLFNDWCAIFCRDKSTGENSVEFDDTVPETEEYKQKEEEIVAEFGGVIEGMEDKNEISVCQPQGSATKNEQTPKKRKYSTCSSDSTLVDAMTVLNDISASSDAIVASSDALVASSDAIVGAMTVLGEKTDAVSNDVTASSDAILGAMTVLQEKQDAGFNDITASSDAIVGAMTVLREKTDAGFNDMSASSDAIVGAITVLREKQDEGFNDISNKIGGEFYISNLIAEVYATLGKIPGLGIRDKIIAGRLLVNKTPDLELFFSLPDEAKAVMVHMLLAEK